jgi:hypothetical protein
MRIENSHRLFYRLHILEKASGNKNGRARKAQPFYNSQVHSPWLLKSEGLWLKLKPSQTQAFRRSVGVQLIV